MFPINYNIFKILFYSFQKCDVAHYKMLVKCLNLENNIDSISKKCVNKLCDFQYIVDVSVPFITLHYVKSLIFMCLIETNDISDLRKINYNSDVVSWRLDNDEIKC